MGKAWFPALRGLGRGAESKSLPDRVRSSSAAYLSPGIPYSSHWDVRRAVAEGYEGNPLVYRATEVIATNAAKQRMVLHQDDPDDATEIIRDVAEDPTRLLYVLNRRANPWETARIFRHRLVAQFLLSSRGCFVEVILAKSGKLGMVNLIDPDLVSMVPSVDNPINLFEIRTPNSSTDSVNYLPPYDPQNPQPSSVLWIRSPHPLVMWEGMSPVQAAGLPIDLDRYARVYNRRFLQNDGRPGGLISVKGLADRDQMELIQSQFTGGPESAGRTTVISADSVSYADTSGSPRDLMWGELSRMTKADIAIAFGVPESVLGDASGRTFDNADAEYGMFWEHRMEPLVRLLDDQLDILTGGYDDNLYLRHDLSKVWVLGRHERERADRAAADLERGAITYDEYREIIGHEPVGAPATQVLWLNVAGRVAVAEDDDLAARAVQTPVLLPGAAAPQDQDAPDDTTLDAPGLPGGDRGGLRLLSPARDETGARALRGLEGKQSRPRPERPDPGAPADLP